MASSVNLPDDLSEIYKQLKQEEAMLSEEVNKLLLDVTVHDSEIKELKQKLPDRSLLLSDLEELQKTINYTLNLSAEVSSKVRKMDIVKNRVAECLHRVGDIADLKSCTESIQEALDNEEYENAALIVQRFLKIDEREVRRSVSISETNDGENGQGNVMTASSMEDAFTKLHEAKRKLQRIVLDKFDEAVKEEDVASVERFFKLFPFLHQEKEGLVRFSRYLSAKLVKDKTKDDSFQTPPEQLGHLFQVIARTIDVHQPLVETYYKHGNLLYVIEELQKSCDRRAKDVIEKFKKDRDFNQVITVVQKCMKNQSNSWTSSNNLKVDTRELDKLLTEIILVTSRCDTYLKFVRKRVQDDHSIAFPDVKSNEYKSAEDRLERFIRNCDLSRLMQDLDGNYVQLEEYFLHETTSKAIELDEEHTNEYLNSEVINEDFNSGNLTSHILDDVFFILKKCIRRANSGGNIDVVCAIINHSIAIIDTIYYDALNERVRFGFPSTISNVAANFDLSQAYNTLQSGRVFHSSSDIEKTKKLFLIGVNDLDQSIEYIKTLKKIVKEEVSRSIINSANCGNQSGKLDSCLTDLTSSTGKFQQLVNYSLTQINVTLVKPITKSWVESFLSLDQASNNPEPEEVDESDLSHLYPFTTSFIVGTENVIKSIKPQLTDTNYNSLIGIFATDVSTRFETAIFKCFYNRVINTCSNCYCFPELIFCYLDFCHETGPRHPSGDKLCYIFNIAIYSRQVYAFETSNIPHKRGYNQRSRGHSHGHSS